MILNAFFAYVLASVEDEKTKRSRKHEGSHRKGKPVKKRKKRGAERASTADLADPGGCTT